MATNEAFSIVEQLIGGVFQPEPRELSASPEVWSEVFTILKEHRLHVFVAAQLLAAPSPLETSDLDWLKEQRTIALQSETLLGLALATLGAACERASVPLVVCKGAVLARDYYPQRGGRVMQDLDVWVPTDAVPEAARILSELGYQEPFRDEQKSARSFTNALGVVVDLHGRMNLFAARDGGFLALSKRHDELPHRVFEPEAMLVHLAFHLLGHARDVGVLLAWVVDIGLVIKRHGSALDWARVRELCPSAHTFLALLRLARFAEHLGVCALPEAIKTQANGLPEISVEASVAMRRWARFKLDHPRGWVKMALAARRGSIPRALLPAEVPRARRLWRAEKGRTMVVGGREHPTEEERGLLLLGAF